jgi:hypothetical protein
MNNNRPIGLTSSQMLDLVAIARPFRPFQRPEFMRKVYAILAGEPSIGDGVIHFEGRKSELGETGYDDLGSRA